MHNWSLNRIRPHGVTILPIRVYKITSTKHGKPPIKTYCSEIPQTIQSIAIALGCLQELEHKTLLLKTPHISDTRLGGIKGELKWKPPSSELTSFHSM